MICKKCNVEILEDKNHDYVFCPHCGYKITKEPEKDFFTEWDEIIKKLRVCDER